MLTVEKQWINVQQKTFTKWFVRSLVLFIARPGPLLYPLPSLRPDVVEAPAYVMLMVQETSQNYMTIYRDVC